MVDKCAEDHFRWIGIMADRIICSKSRENELPLLSLSFLEGNNILEIFSKFSRPAFPITVENLSNAKLYGIVVSAITSNNKTNLSDFEYIYDFDSILTKLLSEGYIPQNPCEPSGLKDGILEQHINLCKSIEFLVVDKSLNTTLLTSDLYYLPHSFYVLNNETPIIHLEDAISLWLSKFHCNTYFSNEIKNESIELTNKNYLIQMDTSKFSKVAACLSRIFPEKIDKDEIQNGENDEEIQYNINLSKLILDPIHAFVIEKFPTDENLFILFISDLFYATRAGVKKFVMVDYSQFKPHLPNESRCLRSPRMRRTFNRSKENEKSCLDLLNAVLSSQHKKRNQPKIIRPKIDSKSSRRKGRNSKLEFDEDVDFNNNNNNNKNYAINNSKSCGIDNQMSDDIIIIDDLKNCKSTVNIKDQKSSQIDDEIVNIDSRACSSGDIIDYVNKQRSYDSNQDALTYYSKESILVSGIFSGSNENNLNEEEEEESNQADYNNYSNGSNNCDESNNVKNKISFGNINHLNKYGSYFGGNFINGFDFKDDEYNNSSKSISKAPSNFDYLNKETKKIKNGIAINNNNAFVGEGSVRINSNELVDNNDFIKTNNNVFAVNDDSVRTNNNEFVDNNDSVRTNNNDVTENNDSIEINNNEIADNNDSVETTNNEISTNDDSIEINSNGITENNDSIETTNNEIAANDDFIEINNNEIADNNDTIETNSNDITENNDSIETNNNEISANDDSIETNNNEFVDNNDSVRTNNNDITENNDSIETNNNEFVDNNDSIETNNNSITENNDSIGTNKNAVNDDSAKINNKEKIEGDTFEKDDDSIENDEKTVIKNDECGDLHVQNNDECENESVKAKLEEEEMSDEVILRELEKYEFHLNLKHLSTNSLDASSEIMTVPNYDTIVNALKFNSLHSPKYTKLLNYIIETMKEFKSERIILLISSKSKEFKGIYILTSDGNMAEKFWGKGPNNVENDDVSIFYKYSSDNKSFDTISSKIFTQNTDGFSLIKEIEDKL